MKTITKLTTELTGEDKLLLQKKHKLRRIVGIFLVVAHLLGFMSSLDAMMSTRTAQGAVAWIVSLNAMPYVAVPAYWVFGRTKFQGYVIARRSEDSELATVLASAMDRIKSYQLSEPYESRHLRAVEALAKMPFLQGNQLELLIDGDAIFDSMFQGIDAASDYILVQSYIIRDDTLGQAFKSRLIDRAKNGVEVNLLYDEIGSYNLPQRFLDELIAAGVTVHWFHSTRGYGNRFQLNFRNHRKVIIVDGKSGWVGGSNIGDEYLGNYPKRGAWRDTHLKVTGPAVLALQLSFVEDWYWATKEILDLPWEKSVLADNGAPVLMLSSGPADRFETASLMIQQAIHAAESRIWISSPYFVPDEGVQNMLKLAALGGVDVRVLIPDEPDSQLANYATYAFVDSLINAGVKIYRYKGGFLHSKSFLVDDTGAAVGTVNLDNRSFRLNFEITAIVLDRRFADEVEQMFLADFESSRLMIPADLDEQSLWFRLASRAAYLLAPVL